MKKIFLRFKNRLSVTFGLLILESIGELLFPLVIGFAIDDLLNKSYEGLFQLSILGFFTILIGAVRRLIDSRFYGYIFVNLGTELAKSQSKLSPSKKSAQLSLLNEIVEFLENSMPSLFTYVVGLLGTMFILFKLNLPVAVGCLISSFIFSKSIAFNYSYFSSYMNRFTMRNMYVLGSMLLEQFNLQPVLIRS